jgi:hypothetical protein
MVVMSPYLHFRDGKSSKPHQGFDVNQEEANLTNPDGQKPP